MLNLHTEVRGAINTVNPDQTAQYLKSTGFTKDASYKQVPTYATAVPAQVQVQALSARDLQHPNFVNIQGVKRTIYMWGNTLGVSRPDVQGGDLIQIPETLGGIVRNWLVVVVFETWTPDALGFCKLGVVLQQDLPL